MGETLRVTDGLEHPFSATSGVSVHEVYGTDPHFGFIAASMPPYRSLCADTWNSHVAPGRTLEEYRGKYLGAYGFVRSRGHVIVKSATGSPREQSWVRVVLRAWD